MTQLIWLLSFLLPFQLSLHLTDIAPTVYGFSIDYLVPTVYVTDIVLFLMFIQWVVKNRVVGNLIGKINKYKERLLTDKRKRKIFIEKLMNKNTLLVLGSSSFLVLNILVSEYPIVSIYKWIKIFEVIFLVLIIKTEKLINIFDHFVKPLSYSLIVVCIIGLTQTFLSRTVSPLLYILGERSFTISTPGISTFSLFGRELLRSYSTFSHPNSLAGFLLVFLFLLFNYKKKFSYTYFCLLLTLIILTLFSSFSLNILIAGTAVVFVSRIGLSRKTILIFLLTASVLMPYMSFAKLTNEKDVPTITTLNKTILDKAQDKTIIDRYKLAKASLQIIESSPVVGVGVNNFIPNLLKTNLKFENSWQLQPVHNIFLLVLSETGILGFFFFVYFFVSLPNIYFILPILFTGLFDHYWLTLQQNILLMAMIIGFSFAKLKKYRA